MVTVVTVVASAACSPAGKREPVGVSNGGGDRMRIVDAGISDAPNVEGLPEDFRATWKRAAEHVTSEHERLIADVYENGDASVAEDLFWGDAGVGVFLIAHEDGGVRYAVGDARGRVVSGNIEGCARCHRDAPHEIFPFK
jgi:hypothetical protein